MTEKEEVFVDTRRVLCLSLLEEYFKAACRENYSEDYYTNVEYMLWDAVHGSPDDMEHWRIDERDVILLKRLSSELGGWLETKVGSPGYVFVSILTWEKRFIKWQAEKGS